MKAPTSVEVNIKLNYTDIIEKPSKTKAFSENQVKLGELRKSIHTKLIDQIKELYGKEEWKYTFVKNAKIIHDVTVQYKQLKMFEAGESRHENLLMVFLMEIIHKKQELKISIDKNRNVRI